MRARITVTTKPDTADRVGDAVLSGLQALGHEGVLQVEAGRVFWLDYGDSPVTELDVSKLCSAVLVDDETERFTIEFIED